MIDFSSLTPIMKVSKQAPARGKGEKMNEVSILSNMVSPKQGEVCTKIGKHLLKDPTPVLAYMPGSGRTSHAMFSTVSEAVGFCQVFDKVVVDGFCLQLPVMPKYKPMAEKGMIKRPLSLEEARQQMILLSEN